MAETATPARVAELQRVDAERARHEARNAEQAEEIAEILGKTVLRFEVKSGPTGSLFGSVTPSTSPTRSGAPGRFASTGARSRSTRSSASSYAVPIELFQDVHVEVKTVVPEGGELPPEEELAALEAAEAEADAVAEAAAESAHAEAESAIAEVLADEVQRNPKATTRRRRRPSLPVSRSPRPSSPQPVEATLARGRSCWRWARGASR